MSTDVTTCTSGDSVDHIMRLMTDRRIRHIPVVDGDRLAGIVSIGDVVKSRIDELETETVDAARLPLVGPLSRPWRLRRRRAGPPADRSARVSARTTVPGSRCESGAVPPL